MAFTCKPNAVCSVGRAAHASQDGTTNAVGDKKARQHFLKRDPRLTLYRAAAYLSVDATRATTRKGETIMEKKPTAITSKGIKEKYDLKKQKQSSTGRRHKGQRERRAPKSRGGKAVVLPGMKESLGPEEEEKSFLLLMKTRISGLKRR